METPRTRFAGPRGMTLIEMLVVITIILILTVSSAGVFTAMQRNSRLRSSTDKVVATLHLARSLAITYNHTYHIRLVNYQVGQPDPLKGQAIAIYCYHKQGDAMQVGKERFNNNRVEVDDEAKHDWSLYRVNPTAFKTQLRRMLDAKGQASDETAIATLAQSMKMWNEDANAFYNNYIVEWIPLDQDVSVGYQELKGTAPQDTILKFHPDGTAEASRMIFVTDKIDPVVELRDNPSLAKEARQVANDLRWDALYTNSGAPKEAPNLRLIRVLQGGLIRLEQGKAPTK